MLISAATILALGAGLVAAVPPLEVRGSSFVNPKNGNRFQVVGVAYQPGGSAGYKPDSGSDPLTQPDDCLRDAAIMQMLGINTIRIYNLNPNLNHDACASIFNAAGMYMMIDVNSPLVGESLTNFNPWESYYASYLNRTFAVVEAFKNYPNTLVFFSGNEVINDVATGKFVPQYQRAVTRDLKNYVAKHCDRKIPVGYSAADVREVLFDTYNYFSCAEDGMENDPSRGDIFALNSYSWCGDSSFEKARYNELVSGFTGNAVPVFYSEFGCIHPKPRMWTEIGTIFSDKMMPVFSGGIVYEYCQEENDYGLVQIKADGSAHLLADFNNLRSQLAMADFATIQSSKPPTTQNKPAKCEAKLITQQGFSTNFTLPVLPPGAKEIIDAGVSPKPSGKLITISDWKVKAAVRNTDGSVIANLAVKPLSDDGSNIPSTTGATSPPTQAGSGPAPTQTKPNGAGSLRETGLFVAVSMAALVGLIL